MTKNYQIILSKYAEKNLTQLYDYIYEYDDPANANYVIEQIQKEIKTLNYFPERGSTPKEFSVLGIYHFKQCYFKISIQSRKNTIV